MVRAKTGPIIGDSTPIPCVGVQQRYASEDETNRSGSVYGINCPKTSGTCLNDKVLTIPEVASFLKISKAKIYLMLQQGKMPYIRVERNVRIWQSDLINWLREQTIKVGN